MAILPPTAYVELEDAITEAMDYTEPGDFEEEVVNEQIAIFDAAFASAKNVVALMKQLQSMKTLAEELMLREYPGLEALAAAYEVASDYAEDRAAVEPAEGQTTEQLYIEVVAAFQAAINAYYESQVATPENPADYTHRVGLPNFQATKNYTIPAPWVVENVQNGGDVWVGTCQPEEAGGAGLPGLNSWSNDFTTMDVHQDIEGLPNGVYTVTAKAITQGLGQQHAYAKSSVGTAVSPDMTIVGWDTPEWETLVTEKVVVIDGKLRIGFASVSAGGVNGWYQVTGYKLHYYGEASAADLQAAWESSVARANEYVEVLLSGDSKDVEAAIVAASAIAAEGNYTEACQALNPVVAASDSIYNVTKKFYEGNYADLETLAEEAEALSCTYAVQVLAAAKQFTDEVKAKALGQNVMTAVRPGQLMVKITHDELANLMGGEAAEINLKGQPAVILMSGLQGSGKTTFSAKLANYLKTKKNKNVMLVAGDVYRPAAINQLQVLGEQIGVPVYAEIENKNPIQIAENALREAKSKGIQVVIVDTA